MWQVISLKVKEISHDLNHDLTFCCTLNQYIYMYVIYFYWTTLEKQLFLFWPFLLERPSIFQFGGSLKLEGIYWTFLGP